MESNLNTIAQAWQCFEYTIEDIKSDPFPFAVTFSSHHTGFGGSTDHEHYVNLRYFHPIYNKDKLDGDNYLVYHKWWTDLWKVFFGCLILQLVL